jgi:hypothetical protein
MVHSIQVMKLLSMQLDGLSVALSVQETFQFHLESLSNVAAFRIPWSSYKLCRKITEYKLSAFIRFTWCDLNLNCITIYMNKSCIPAMRSQKVQIDVSAEKRKVTGLHLLNGMPNWQKFVHHFKAHTLPYPWDFNTCPSILNALLQPE